MLVRRETSLENVFRVVHIGKLTLSQRRIGFEGCISLVLINRVCFPSLNKIRAILAALSHGLKLRITSFLFAFKHFRLILQLP